MAGEGNTKSWEIATGVSYLNTSLSRLGCTTFSRYARGPICAAGWPLSSATGKHRTHTPQVSNRPCLEHSKARLERVEARLPAASP